VLDYFCTGLLSGLYAMNITSSIDKLKVN